VSEYAGKYPEGVWVSDDGALHFDIEAMVRGAGYEPTPANLRVMEQAARDLAAQVGAEVAVAEEEGHP
jgi:hypothetical protein